MNETAHQTEYGTLSTLYLALELSQKKWKLVFTVSLGQAARKRTVEAGDLMALQKAIQLARKRLELPERCRVLSCYEAGRDGFWLHRRPVRQGIENLVVDSASIEVNRRAKRGFSGDVRRLRTSSLFTVNLDRANGSQSGHN